MKKIRVIALGSVVIILFMLVNIMSEQQFTSVEDLRAYIEGFGITGMLVMIVFQIFQTLVPILPDCFGCAAGTITFGTVVGFICSYVGICSGSVISYFIGRKYGKKAMKSLFTEKEYITWNNRIEKCKSYKQLLFISGLIPLFPYRYLCYYSGLIKMDIKKFVCIITFAELWRILIYSLLFGMVK